MWVGALGGLFSWLDCVYVMPLGRLDDYVIMLILIPRTGAGHDSIIYATTTFNESQYYLQRVFVY